MLNCMMEMKLPTSQQCVRRHITNSHKKYYHIYKPKTSTRLQVTKHSIKPYTKKSAT